MRPQRRPRKDSGRLDPRGVRIPENSWRWTSAARLSDVPATSLQTETRAFPPASAITTPRSHPPTSLAEVDGGPSSRLLRTHPERDIDCIPRRISISSRIVPTRWPRRIPETYVDWSVRLPPTNGNVAALHRDLDRDVAMEGRRSRYEMEKVSMDADRRGANCACGARAREERWRFHARTRRWWRAQDPHRVPLPPGVRSRRSCVERKTHVAWWPVQVQKHSSTETSRSADYVDKRLDSGRECSCKIGPS